MRMLASNLGRVVLAPGDSYRDWTAGVSATQLQGPTLDFQLLLGQLASYDCPVWMGTWNAK